MFKTLVSFNHSIGHKLTNYTTLYRMSSQLVKVQVKQGIVVGQQKQLPNGNLYQSFQGIPYAVPPVGPLRFKSPLPLEKFDVPELDCLKERDVCHQRDAFTAEIIGSENCLFLNIYTPKKNNSSGPLPVMVWIHGGGFWFGHGNSDYYLPLSLLQEDVIVVTLNYRLGALGFLCLPEEGIWGNAGLKDQRLALQWIQENIVQFNGDPNNVTLFGESAGAASVHLHMYSNHANKLFHKTIMQSGAANAEWVFQVNPAYKVRKLAEELGLKNTSDTKELLQFLQSPQITPLHMLEKTLKTMTADERRRHLPLPFKPVIEDSQSPDAFIDQPIVDRLKQVNSVEIPSIMGYNSAEGLGMMINAVRKVEEYDRDFKRMVPRNIPLSPDDPELEIIARKMRDFYMNGHKLSPKVFNELVNILTDYHFAVDMQLAAEWQVRLQANSPLYFYYFDYVGSRNFYKTMLQMSKLKGASHGDELFYLFQMAGNDDMGSREDQRVTKQISELWANFAKTSNPTPEPGTVGCKWLPVKKPTGEHDSFNLNYLLIDDKGCRMQENLNKDRMEFWRSIYEKYSSPLDYSIVSSKL
ncbi:carboxylic ester hydrolase [Musca vetustissima]|uniref:carboxylic ester hydrolase n=1 Tax=Musca vetustissima TaxID=27455 RepID=UPI002AB7CD86|nr:carboxylic ester hydrolase [Musca vetustissima]